MTIMNLFDAFDLKNIEKIYEERIKNKRSKGIDKVSSSQFAQNKEGNFIVIQRKCLNGSYKFTPYREQLKLKNRDSKPRMISVPSIRDKIVLRILKEVIQTYFPEAAIHKLPNKYIHDIKIQLKLLRLDYFQTDIKSFYDDIDHTTLIKILSKRISDPTLMGIIGRALITATIPSNTKKLDYNKFIPTKGVPQGLPISNILAQIYLLEFDHIFLNDRLPYFRYVDDILFIFNRIDLKVELQQSIIQYFQKLNLGLLLNESKTKTGSLADGFEYLGYKLSGSTVSISEKNTQRFINRISAKIAWFKELWFNKNKRLHSYQEDNKLKEVFIEELNEKITGARNGDKNYGTIFYFSEINDLQLLFRLDKIILTLFQKLDQFDDKAPQTLKRCVRTFFEIKNNPDSNYIIDYSLFLTTTSKANFLIRRGQIVANHTYTDEQIVNLFTKYKSKNLADLEEDVSYSYF